MLVCDDGSIVGTIGGGCVEADVWQAAREVLQVPKQNPHPFAQKREQGWGTVMVLPHRVYCAFVPGSLFFTKERT
jgi:xanthine dehydrogenase accessory factor